MSAATSLGPRQRANVKADAVNVWLLAQVELAKAVENNDAERIAEVAEVIVTVAERIAKTANRASGK